MDWISNPEVWSALAALLALEVVLGVDNVVFISILASKLPVDQQDRARKTGLLAAAGIRVLLLFGVGWIVSLKTELFTAFGVAMTGKDLVLLAGGIFLIYKATKEIHHKLEGEEGEVSTRTAPTFGAVIGQVLLLDIVFSIDSILTAVGMTDHLPIMIVAVVVAVTVMLLASGPLARFIHDNPTVVMLALGFLLMIGMVLIADGFGIHLPKEYVYAAMAFSAFVEGLNLVSRKKKTKPGDGASPPH